MDRYLIQLSEYPFEKFEYMGYTDFEHYSDSDICGVERMLIIDDEKEFEEVLVRFFGENSFLLKCGKIELNKEKRYFTIRDDEVKKNYFKQKYTDFLSLIFEESSFDAFTCPSRAGQLQRKINQAFGDEKDYVIYDYDYPMSFDEAVRTFKSDVKYYIGTMGQLR